MVGDSYYLGLTLVIIGLALIVFGFLTLRSGGGRTSTDYGGVIIVGPIPIVFAKNKNTALILLVLVLAIILVLYLVPLLMSK